MRDLRPLAAFFLLPLVFATTPIQAQSPVMVEPQLRLNVSPVDRNLLRRIDVPELPRDMDLSKVARTNFRPVIQLSRNRSVRLPLPLDFRLSEDRETLVQFGDPLFGMHPQRVDLYWIGADGGVRRQVTNQFDGNAQVNLSSDGYLAVAGAAFLSELPQGSPKPKRVQLFDPRGNALAETNVDAAREVTQLVPISEGQGVLYATAPGERPLQDNQLFVLQKEETRRIETEGLGIIQKVAPLSEAQALVQGTNGFALVDLAQAQIRWLVPERIRLVGPNAAARAPDGTLLIMTGERRSSAALYRWTLSVLDIESGKTIGQRALDGEAPGTFDTVFEDLREGSALIRFGDEARRVSYR